MATNVIDFVPWNVMYFYYERGALTIKLLYKFQGPSGHQVGQFGSDKAPDKRNESFVIFHSLSSSLFQSSSPPLTLSTFLFFFFFQATTLPRSLFNIRNGGPG